MKANQYRKHIRRTPVCGGLHPSGGFVAWPDHQMKSAEEIEMYELAKRRRERRGYVAWPAKQPIGIKIGGSTITAY
jgi:hypothetical protein